MVYSLAFAGLMMGAGCGHATPPPVAQADAITQIVDRHGKKLTAADLPAGLADASSTARKAFLDRAQQPVYMGSALVVARLVYPGSDKDQGGVASLAGQSWFGGWHLQVSDQPNVVAIMLNSDDLVASCRFKALKMGFQTTVVPLPTPLPRGTLVWLGDVVLTPDTSPTVVLQGTVVDQQGKVLDLSGMASLGLNGGPSEMLAKVAHGRYSFPAVHPGEYIVEANCDAYKIDFNFATVKPGPKPSVVQVKAVLIPKSIDDIVPISTPADGPWLSSYSEARKASVEQKKPIFFDFTGSDWCGWCKVFDKEVLSTPEFLEFSKAHFILLRVDLPHQTQLPLGEMKQNQQLAAMFGVNSFPSFYVLSPGGTIIFHQDGYSPGGPKPFLAKLQNLAEPKPVANVSSGT